ncbi:hypothetical protein KY338_04325 [Candidatus Woesearchaeota archaeon]|nr:hypothetical protein [Candidatus Woesearchaeota archaeon]MBW3005792.1 hypothetical protein [Candidatus Woesearchaeota archaeon]
MKRKKSGLIAAIASILLPGCVEKVTEYVDVQGPQQQHVSQIVDISEDGSRIALKTSIEDDIEAAMHKDGQIHNLSRNSEQDNITLGLAGNNVIAKKKVGKDKVRLNIFDESGAVLFESEEFAYIGENARAITPDKVLFYAWDGVDGGQVFLHRVSTNDTEQLFPNALYSDIKGTLGDIVFIGQQDENFITTTYALKPGTSTFPEGILVQISSGKQECTNLLASSGNTAVFSKWVPVQEEIFVYDALNDVTKPLILPANRGLGWEFRLSHDGAGMIAKFSVGPNHTDYEWWYVDTTQGGLNPTFIAPVTTVNENFQFDRMSLDGKVAAFQDRKNHRTFIFDAETQWFEDPLEWVAGVEDSYCKGFSADGRAVIQHWSTQTEGSQINLYDPQTHAFTEVGDNNEDEYSNGNVLVTNDGKYAAIQARDVETNDVVILLESLVTGGKDAVISVEGSDLALIGITPDSENLLLCPYDWESNTDLMVYNIPDSKLRTVTNVDPENRCWFEYVKSSGDDDVHVIRQFNNNGTNAYLKLDEDEPVAELIGYGK